MYWSPDSCLVPRRREPICLCAGSLAVTEWCARAAAAAAMRNEDNKCELVDSGLATAFVSETKLLAESSEASEVLPS